MGHAVLAEELASQAVEAVELHGGNKAEAARAIGISRSTLRHRLESAFRFYGMQPSSPKIPVPAGYNIKNSTITVRPDGTVGNQWARVHQTMEGLEDWVCGLEDRIKSKGPKLKPPKFKAQTDVLQVLVGDPHVGMKAWAECTGEEWNLEKAYVAHRDAIINLIDRADDPHEIILTFIGDILHSDKGDGTSRSGHILDIDAPLPLIIDALERLLNDVIHYAATHAHKVTVVLIGGNHGADQGAPFLQRLMYAWWADTDHVEIPIFNEDRLCIQRGANLLYMDHGDRIKPQELPIFIADKYSDIWSATDHRFADRGHIHHRRKYKMSQESIDRPGIAIEYLRVMIPNERYANDAGYSTIRGMMSRSYDLDYGYLGTQYVTPEMIGL